MKDFRDYVYGVCIGVCLMTLLGMEHFYSACFAVVLVAIDFASAVPWKRLAALIIAALLIPSVALADMETAYRATCRIRAGAGSGTGCVYQEDATYYYVLSNAHVCGASPGQSVSCIFNVEGRETQVPGYVCWSSGQPETRDQAVVAIKKSDVSFRPGVIPLAPRNYILQGNESVGSVGCPKGGWNALWRGHAISNNGRTMDFLPSPLPGRSGSAIFDQSFSQIVGLVTWSAGDVGRGQTIQEIWDGLEGARSVVQPAPGRAVQQADVVLYDFYADWCGPCKQMQPVIEQLSREGVPVQKVDTDRDRDLQTRYGVNVIPTLVLAINGQEVWRSLGPKSASEIKSAVRQVCDQQGVQCPTCPSPGGMSPPSMGRPPGGDFNPYPRPPAAPSVPPPAASPPVTTPDQLPQPPTTSPPADKGCECEPHKECSCDLTAIQGQLDAINKAISELNKPEQPVEPPTCPGSEPPKLSHYVVVGNFDDESWPRTEGELVLARKSFPKIHVVTKDKIPFEVDVTPQLVAYDTTGAAMSIRKGQHAVEDALRRIARKEL